MIGVAVLGTGIMGADHARLLSTVVAGARLAGTFDMDPARAAAVAEPAPGARVFTDPHSMITDPGVDAVLIASSDASHEQFVLACLAAGKPVLCEKPLAPTVAGCERILGAEVSLGSRLISVGFMRRHDPGYRAMQATLAGGSLGAALLVHNVHRNAAAGADIPSAHLITGSAVHEIDAMRWLLAEELVAVTVHRPRAASASGTTVDPMFLVFESASGVLADVEIFVNAGYGYEVRCELVGETGTLTLDAPVPVLLRNNLATSRVLAADWRPRFAEAYRHELQDWIDAVAAGRPSGCASAWDGYAATAVAAVAVQALQNGGRMTIALSDQPDLYRSPGVNGG